MKINIINRNTLIQKLFILYMLGLTLGNGVYLYMSLIRLDLIMIFPMAILLTVFGTKLKFSKLDIALFFSVFSYIAIISLYFSRAKDSITLLDIYYMLSVYNIMMFMFLLLKNKKYYVNNLKLIYNTFYFLLFLVFLSILFELFTGYRFSGNMDGSKSLLIASFFNNPNNLAVASLMMFLVVFYLSKQFGSLFRNITIFIVEMSILLVTMSRFSLLVFFLVLFSTFWTNLYFLTFIILFIFIVGLNFESMLLSLKESDIELISLNAERLWLGVYGLGEDKSVSYRSQIYEYFWNHTNDVSFLGYGTRNYSDFFHSNELASTNPHSFIIENFLAFGFIGGGLFLSIFMVMLLRLTLRKKMGLSPLFMTMMAFLALSFVPSSLLRLSLMWTPLFLFFLVNDNDFKKGKM